MPAQRTIKAKITREVIVISDDDEPDPPTVAEWVSDYFRQKKIRERLAAKRARRKRRDELSEREAQIAQENQKLELASSSLKDFTSCVICLENMTDPVAIICGHTFCRTCIAHEAEAQLSRADSPANKKPAIYTCPTCRIEIQRDHPFIPMHGLRSVIAAIPSEN